MNVAGVSWTTFRLPLRAPFRTAAGEITCREGLLLRLSTDAGIVGLGEASPHPALGQGAVREAEAALERVAPHLIGSELACLDTLYTNLPPALACALDVATCDAMARARRVSVARLLSADVRSRVPVNAVISGESVEEAARQAAAAHAAGFPALKLKVGLGPIDEERRLVAAVREAVGPDVALRLDANGAWDAEGAIGALRALEAYDLEFVEQPVPAEDVEGLRRVQRSVATPIAADEAVSSVEAARRVLALGAARILVVKPMVVGGLRPGQRIVQFAREAGAAIVITTTIDTGIGVAAALHLAATLPGDSPACGLATSSLLADDVVIQPLVPRDGVMTLPEKPGLGVELDERALARYALSHREVP